MSVYQIKKDFSTSHVKSYDDYEGLYSDSIKDPHSFWMQAASRLEWMTPPQIATRGDFTSVNYEWFSGGKLNVSYNCVDRHLKNKKDKTAIIWAKDDPHQYEYITYQDLYENVNRMSHLLKSLGVKKGDRVCLYLPMIPELAYAMLACSRLGAIHSIVFAGFSAEALKGRILDAECKVILTANEGLRGGKVIPLKKIVDEAVIETTIEKVVVFKRTDSQVAMIKNRDVDGNAELKKFRSVFPPEAMDSEDPLFILYTSGSTGKPKGVLHTTGGYLTYASLTHQYIFDYQPKDIYFCAADIGWVTGHTYIIYGPLSNGATTVMFESTPTYPDSSRYWKIVEDLKVNIFYTAPTALRTIAKDGDAPVKKHDRSSLKLLGSVGEPINPEIWKWYFDVVGEKKCPIVDTWWQTETGGILISPLACGPMKPGSATKPFFGIEPVIVKPETGEVLEGNGVEGALCLKHSWPGQARTIYNDHSRFVETYFSQYKGLYFTGDGCRRDEDGFYWITGRIDDVLNVSGHRLGTAEIESALIEHPAVVEAAVVGFPHDIKGVGIYAYVILYEEHYKNVSNEFIESIKEQVRNSIGRFAAPDTIHITKGLPKTRSGKVMRRILRKIAENIYEGLGDTSTLADPNVVNELINEHKALKKS